MTPTPPSWPGVGVLATAAAGFWTAVGWPLARRVVPAGVPVLGCAPLLGWAVHTAVASAVLGWVGFGVWSVACVGSTCLALAWMCAGRGVAWPGLPVWVAGLAALAACAPAAAIMPKVSPAGIGLAAPIFDHSKIPIIDAIARLGLPPINPFYGGAEIAPHLSYYYWWHFSAAELARLAGVNGWAADAALTWFTGFASLLLMAGIAAALTRRAAPLAICLALIGGLRPLTGALERVDWLRPATGLGAWLNQASWAPQHLAAAAALVLALLVLAGLAETPGWAGVAVLGALIATGFGSSTWVGGIVCALALPAAAITLAGGLPAPSRPRFLAMATSAGVLGLLLAAPLLSAQAAAATSWGGFPVAAAFYPVFGKALHALDPVGFPLLMVTEFPVAATLGIAGAVHLWRTGPLWHRGLIIAATAAALVCLCLRSTIDNNDLGWRAILPALLILTPYAAAAIIFSWKYKRLRIALAAIPLLGLPATAQLLHANLTAQSIPTPEFAAEARMWAAIRAATPPNARIATDPRLDAAMTPWPANIGWALLSNRASCYSGWATAHPFAPIPAMNLYATDTAFKRLFDGASNPALLARLHCDAMLITPQSPAWTLPPSHVIASAPGIWRLEAIPRP